MSGKNGNAMEIANQQIEDGEVSLITTLPPNDNLSDLDLRRVIAVQVRLEADLIDFDELCKQALMFLPAMMKKECDPTMSDSSAEENSRQLRWFELIALAKFKGAPGR